LQIVKTGIGELPPGAEISDSDDYDLVDTNDPHRALNIDLDMPLREDERLPVLEHRVIENNVTKKSEEKGNKKEKVNCFYVIIIICFDLSLIHFFLLL
jgi:AP-3 complex subunit delta-1